MGHEVGALIEALPTLATFIGSFSCVDPLVLNEGRAVGEALPTGIALKRPLACVCSLVRDQMGALTESFVAIRTTERPFS